jgi:crossover junction endodeoxyribonuclease RusA
MIYTFTAPFPPSINGYWRTVRNRQIISKRGRDYRASILKYFKILGLEDLLIDKRVKVSMMLNPPTLRSYDVDNFTKAVFDGMTHAGFWVDDSQMQELTVIKGEKIKGGNVIVKVEIIK